MFQKNLLLTACVCLAATIASGQTSYIFQVPGANSPTTLVAGLGDDFSSASSRSVQTPSALAGAFQVLATPNGAKFFIVAPGGIQSATAPVQPNTALGSLTSVVSGNITSAAITPDGKYLLAVGDLFYVVRTSDNSVVQTNVGVPTNSTPVGVAVSRDSQTAWVLSTDNNTGGAVESVNLSTFQNSPPTALSNIDKTTSITLSPLGLLYVTSTGDLLYEVDPATMAKTPTGNIQIPSGLYGPLRFTPDGFSAYSVNRNVCSACASLIMFNATAHNVTGWPGSPDGTQPTFSDVFAGGAGHVYAFAPRNLNPSASTADVWDVTASPFSAAASALGGFQGSNQGLPIYNVVAMAMSNEPTPRFLYLLTQDSTRAFIRISLADGSIIAGGYFDPNKGPALSFTPIPALSGAAQLFTLNRTPNVAPGAVSTPLVGQVVTSDGRPVMGVPVCFSSASSDLLVVTPSQVTNADGWVQTTTVPSQTAVGPYAVTLGVGAACPNPGNLLSATFTVTVGATTTTGNAQITIYEGNGQLLRQNSSTGGFAGQGVPLTVQITQPDGITPISGANVTFSITQGIGAVFGGSSFSTTTDANGLASTSFVTSIVNQGSPHSYQLTVVTASSDYGSVEFSETTQNSVEGDSGGIPKVTPPDPLELSVAQGDIVPNAIHVLTTSGHAPDSGQSIPNIGIRLITPNSLDPSPVFSCQGSALGGDDGVTHCNVLAVCQPAGTLPQIFGVTADVGEYAFYPMQITVKQGNASRLSVVSGNNQSGNPSQTFTLVARVTDSCNQNVNGVPVTWSIQGSASFGQQQTVSQNGTISAQVTLGATPGLVQVTVSGAGLAPAVFSLTTKVAVGGISIVSGGGQSGLVGQPFPNPVVFVVTDTKGNPVPNLPVGFSVSGNATINPISATTNGLGQVQTNVTAGATVDTISVTATSSNLFATAVLSSRLAGPSVTSASFTNAASGAVGLTPCGLVSVFGNGLAPTVQGVITPLNSFAGLPLNLAGVSIGISQGGLSAPIQAPIQAVANISGVQQVNFQAPCQLQAGTATVTVTVNNVSTVVPNVPVLAVQPGLFVSSVSASNKSYGYVVSETDGTLVTAANPALRGQKYFIYVTGLGQATPTIVTNTAGTGQNVITPVIVGINNGGVPVLSARYLAGSIGVYLIEFQIPADAQPGTDQALAVASILNGGANFSDYNFGNPLFLPAVQ